MPDNVNLLWGQESNLPEAAQKGNIYVATDTGNTFVDISANSLERVKLGPKAGSDILMTGYNEPSTASDVLATDTVNQAIGKVEKKADDAIAAAAIKKYTATNPALTSSEGLWYWEIGPETHLITNNALFVSLYDAGSGEQVVANVAVKQATYEVGITIADSESVGTLAAGSYRVVIIG